ncbi:hypothetical protein XELAEV_18035344mg [Xenopus laevis]|uniref:Endonuclease/exonuclease/phosphatase domain-containing protein n=1 Tax=Xenopus laevis TaxID=8355 RepID=A0A974CGN6_XENLA|nr:hypothetical protein XELAEV_18035344mg [Xenopus laevis]
MHFTQKSYPKFFHKLYHTHYLASTTSKHRGVAIFIHKNFPFITLGATLDANGRYVILQGTLYDQHYTIISSYAPNDDPLLFFDSLCNLLPDLNKTRLIWAGDFNLSFNHILDRSLSNHPMRHKTSTKRVERLLHTHRLIDSWREVNGSTRDYTFYSHPHNSYSRIDYILVNASDTPSLLDSKHIQCAWSDHDLVQTTLNLQVPLFRRPTWRLNESLLADPECIDFISQEIKHFFQDNLQPDASIDWVWVAHKAYIRGCLIKYASRKKKERMQVSKGLSILKQSTEGFEKKSKSSVTEDDVLGTELLSRISNMIPPVNFDHLHNTSCARNSRATVINAKDKYCIGDNLTIEIVMYDFIGNKKHYGGDFIRARIFNTKLAAGATGRIEDFNNGIYHVHFTLFWEGQVEVSLLLYHSSEAVSALWRSRNQGYGLIKFTGTFQNGNKNVKTKCGFQVDNAGETCTYEDTKYNELFYCSKTANLSCGSLAFLQSFNQDHSFFSYLQKSLFKRLSPFPSTNHVNSCLKDKMIYLMGDSTLRQWFLHLVNKLKNLKNFNLHRTGLESMLLAIDPEKNILLQWKKHSHPIVASRSYSVKDDAYISEEIDRLAGGPNTVIAITAGQHFRPFPIRLFIKRVINIRRALESLFIRSPETKVIIKAENTREFNLDVERFSDFYGYIQNLIVKEMFQDLPVAVVDAWDMTIAFNSNDVHPAENVIRNQINMFLTYIC